MSYKDDVFKHFDIDEGDMEKLIEIWKFFNKKDEPRPLTRNTVYLNSKYKDVTSHQLHHALKYLVFTRRYFLERHIQTCFYLMNNEIIEDMYNYFLEHHLGVVKETVSNDGAKPEKKKRTVKKK